MTEIIVSKSQLAAQPKLEAALKSHFRLHWLEHCLESGSAEEASELAERREQFSDNFACHVDYRDQPLIQELKQYIQHNFDREQTEPLLEHVVGLTLSQAQQRRRLADYIKKHDIKLAVLHGDYLAKNRPLLYATKDTQITSLNLEKTYHFVVPELSYFKPSARRHVYLSSDFMVVDSELEQAHMQRNNLTMNYVPQGEFLALGSPNNSSLYTTESEKVEVNVREVNDGAGERLTLAILIPWNEGKTPSRVLKTQIDEAEAIESLFSELSQRAMQDKVFIILKLHPMFQNRGVAQAVQGFYEALLAQYHLAGEVRVSLLCESMHQADIIICQRFTPLLWDAIRLGKLAIVWQHDDYLAQLMPTVKLEDSNELFRQGMLSLVTSVTEIVETVNHYEERIMQFSARRKLFMKSYQFYTEDEKVHNIVAWIKKGECFGNSRRKNSSKAKIPSPVQDV